MPVRLALCSSPCAVHVWTSGFITSALILLLHHVFSMISYQLVHATCYHPLPETSVQQAGPELQTQGSKNVCVRKSCLGPLAGAFSAS